MFLYAYKVKWNEMLYLKYDMSNYYIKHAKDSHISFPLPRRIKNKGKKYK